MVARLVLGNNRERTGLMAREKLDLEREPIKGEQGRPTGLEWSKPGLKIVPEEYTLNLIFLVTITIQERQNNI